MSQTLQELYATLNAGRPTVAVPAVLLHLLNPAQAVLMAQMLWWCDQAGGTASKTSAEIEEATGLDRHQQLRISRQLAAFGLHVERRGYPAVNHFWVDLEQFAKAAKPQMRESTHAANLRMRGNAATESEIAATDSQMRGNAPLSCGKTAHLISTDLRVLKEGEVQLRGNAATEQTPHQIETPTTTAQPPVAIQEGGQPVPTPDNPYPQTSHQQGLEAEQRIVTAAPRLAARLVELRRISGRPEHNYRLWLRDFVAPHIERLGPAFAMSLEAALKQGVLANPQYALQDVVRSLEAASPPPREVLRKLSQDQLLDEIIAGLVATPAGGGHGPN